MTEDSRPFSVWAIGAICILAWGSVAEPQVVFDETFGAAGPAPLDPAGQTILVEQDRGGTITSGGRSHLLHSFDSFSVGSGETVEFRTDDAVATILSRVTGGNVSRIDGNLRVRNEAGIGGPDLFLLNANGVLFGDQTRIDMDGAFVATSAQGVRFADGGYFASSDLAAPLPSTAAAPTHLVFEALPFGAGGDVEITGRRLISTSGSATQGAAVIRLVGRNVRVAGSGALLTDGAPLEIGAVGQGGLDVPVDLSALEDRDLATGAITIDGGTGVFNLQTSSPGVSQGRVVIRGGELVLTNAGFLTGGDGLTGADSLAVDIAVGGAVRLEGSAARIDSFTSGSIGPGGIQIVADEVAVGQGATIGITNNGSGGETGSLSIEADRIEVDGAFAEIKSTANGSGAGGEVLLRANEIQILNDGRIVTEVLPGATGQGGGLELRVDSLLLSSSGEIESSTAGAGDGGAIDVDGNRIALSGEFTQIATTTRGAGQGGSLSIATDSLSLEENARVLSESLTESGVAAGAGGQIGIEAREISLSGSADLLSVTRGDSAGGAITVSGDELILTESSGIVAASGGSGPGGSIGLSIAEITLDEGAAIGTGPLEVRPGEIFEGPGGDVGIAADRLTIMGGAQISTTTDGAQRAGNLSIDVEEQLTISGVLIGGNRASGIFARSGLGFGSAATGAGGTITLEAGQLEVLDGGQISVESVGTGNAGETFVRVDRDLILRGGAITARATDRAVAGVLDIEVGGDAQLSEGGRIEATAPVEREFEPMLPDSEDAGDIRLAVGRSLFIGDADSGVRSDSTRIESGNIAITSGETVTIVDGAISTNIDSVSGQGGNISIETPLLAISGGQVSANALGENDGAGDVRVRATQGILRAGGGLIEARANLGLSGQVELAAPETNLAGELGALASEVRDEDASLRDPCEAKHSKAGSFEIVSRPLQPREVLESGPRVAWVDHCAKP